MNLQHLCLKKGEDKRLRGGHPWIFSNEVNTSLSPLKTFQPGEQVLVQASDNSLLGVAYINPHSLITARIFSHDINERLNTDFLHTQLQQALILREHLFTQPYYRLVFSEADKLPGLVIDRYGNDFVVQTNTAGMEQHHGSLREAMLKLFPDTRSILLRNDSPIRQQEGLNTYTETLFGTPPLAGEVEENSVRFTFPMVGGQKTGWFYDHRQNRARLQPYVPGKTVLDVFSYLGGFGIQAAAFGASHADCLDTSAAACDFIKKNAELNQLSNKVDTLCMDAFDGLKELIQRGKKYDVIILDPPAFVKKAKDFKEGITAYQRINELALRLLNNEGILFSCSCSMHVSQEELWQAIKRAATRTQTTLQLLERGHQGIDHPIHLAIPETDYLKAFILRKIS